ncbi:MAG TPA: TorF family putative porin [Methyloceanibacter sp.]|jgi:uncharacterized protein (TIGR02001 family)|nr:TorF family putative porin [Methyloceanibacter sp.]
MARRREAGIIKTCVLGAALAAGLATAAQADELKLSATTAFVTDYLFRGVTNTGNGPAVQPEVDLYWGIFYAGMWGSNTDFGDGVEIDYYVGITPKWRNITFNFAALYYSYPGANSEIDYFEAKAGASWTGGNWTIAVTNYWGPDFSNFAGSSNAIEGQVGYALNWKPFNFFSPTISGGVAFQSFEEDADDYTYWNAGLTLAFMEHWSVDARYWDTDLSDTGCSILSGIRNGCDERVVGTLKAVF